MRLISLSQSLAGYAGGLNANKDNLVCYHNFQGIADYGSLGHGEVVGMTIPEDRYVDFATEYLSLFGKDLDRPDKGDMGPEYRSLIGLPGGSSNKLYDTFANVAKQRGFIVKEGQGNDPDTLFKKTIYVMDSNKFPFYPAEVYHQYHGNFLLFCIISQLIFNFKQTVFSPVSHILRHTMIYRKLH